MMEEKKLISEMLYVHTGSKYSRRAIAPYENISFYVLPLLERQKKKFDIIW